MESLTKRIERRLAEDVEAYVAVEEDGEVIVLSGLLGAEGERQAVLDVVADVAPGRRIEDNMEAPELLSEGVEEGGLMEPGDFASQHILTDPLAAAGAGATGLESDVAAEGDAVYVPPIDPVGGSRTVVGGFETSSLDSLEVDRSAFGGPGDEAIADAIRRELREDAATAGLAVGVAVRNGVVRLHGRVPLLDDSDNAAEVAARVPGVVEVREELDVEGGRLR